MSLLLALSNGLHAQQDVDSSFHLYLLIGQSNMAGRGTPDMESKKQDPKILMLDSINHWVIATDPVHFDKPSMTGVGPAISFATEMLQSNTNVKIGLIPCAVGGSPIRVWEPDSVYLNVFHPYNDAIARTKLAMQTGVLKGILWHQGEADNVQSASKLYLEKLKILVERLRTDLDQPGLPFVAGEIGYFNKRDFINAVINQLPRHVLNTAVVSAKDLNHKGDSIHFNTASARELGKRYAVEMKKLTSNDKSVQTKSSATRRKILILSDNNM